MVLLRVTRIMYRRYRINAPFFRTCGCARACFIGAYLSRTVRAVGTPFGFELRTAKVMNFVIHFIMNFLGTGGTVRAIVNRFFVFLYLR